MELKVWVEGIQRIVCGVTDGTTCQDVVFALAHATGKTGRFTLIERWRNNERLLAPSELPLKILMKWGERSNDVQFILQWSPLESTTASSSSASASTTTTNPPPRSAPTTKLPDFTSLNHESNSPSLKSSSGHGTPTNSAHLPQPQPPPNHFYSNGYLNNNNNNNNNNGTKRQLGQFLPAASTTTNLLSGSNGLIGNWPVDKNYYSNKSGSGGSGGGGGGVDGVGIDREESDGGHKNSTNLRTDHSSVNYSNKSASASQLLRSSNNNGKLINSNKYSFPRIEDESSSSSPSRRLKDSNSSSAVIIPSPSSTTSTATAAAAPPPYREPPNPATNKGSGSSSNKELPPYREPPPPSSSSSSSHGTFRLGNNPSPVFSLNSFTGSISSTTTNNNNNNGLGLVTTSSSSSSVVQLSLSRESSTASTITATLKESNLPSNNTKSSTEESMSSTGGNLILRKNKDSMSTLSNGSGSGSSSPVCNGSGGRSGSVNPSSSSSTINPIYRDLVRLINLQREKLTAQQAELTQYDAEIMYWEGKAREQEKQMDFISKEMTRLESVSTQHESQMLSLSHIEQENELLANESERLRTELSSLKSQFSQCEKDLSQYKSRIRLLSGEVESTATLLSQREEERKGQEAATLAEIERVRKELELARREADEVTDLSGSLEIEVSTLETALTDKKKQMELLVTQMKEANLQSLAIQSPTMDDSAAAMVDSGGGNVAASNSGSGGSHFRTGSTRRMIGSPRQLENAAPTTKNPHGVWV